MLHYPCCIFHKITFISKFLSFCVQIIYFFLCASSYSFIPHFIFNFSFLPIHKTALFKAISSHYFTLTLIPSTVRHITVFTTWLILLPCRWRLSVPRKYSYLCGKLPGILSQKTTVKNSDDA